MIGTRYSHRWGNVCDDWMSDHRSFSYYPHCRHVHSLNKIFWRYKTRKFISTHHITRGYNIGQNEKYNRVKEKKFQADNKQPISTQSYRLLFRKIDLFFNIQ